jgi:hypothetical protein
LSGGFEGAVIEIYREHASVIQAIFVTLLHCNVLGWKLTKLAAENPIDVRNAQPH